MSVIIVIGIVLAAIVGIVAFGLIGGTVIFFTVNFIFETWENIESAIAVRRIKRNKLRDTVDPAKLAADRASVRSRIDAL